MNKGTVKLLLFLSLSLILFIGIQAQPAYAFSPSNIKITPNPQNIPSGGAGVVTVEIKGTITFADQQAQKFEVRLVDEDGFLRFGDDLLGKATVTPRTDGKGVFIKGDVRTFTLTFKIRCNRKCEIVGSENSWESEADLAVEIDSGRIEEKKNHYDTKAKKAVPVRGTKRKSTANKIGCGDTIYIGEQGLAFDVDGDGDYGEAGTPDVGDLEGVPDTPTAGAPLLHLSATYTAPEVTEGEYYYDANENGELNPGEFHIYAIKPKIAGDIILNTAAQDSIVGKSVPTSAEIVFKAEMNFGGKIPNSDFKIVVTDPDGVVIETIDGQSLTNLDATHGTTIYVGDGTVGGTTTAPVYTDAMDLAEMKTGTYKVKIKTEKTDCNMLDISSSEMEFIIRSEEVAIEAIEDTVGVGEDMVLVVNGNPKKWYYLTVTGVDTTAPPAIRGDVGDVKALSGATVISAAAPNLAAWVQTGSDGIADVKITTTNADDRTYTIHVYDKPATSLGPDGKYGTADDTLLTQLTGFTADGNIKGSADDDDVDIKVRKPTVTFDMPKSVIIGEEIEIKGTISAGDEVDILIDDGKVKYVDDEPVDENNEFEVKWDTSGMTTGSYTIDVYIDCAQTTFAGIRAAGIDEDGKTTIRLVIPTLTAKQLRNTIAEDDDYEIEGTAFGVDDVDIVLIGPKGYRGGAFTVLNGFRVTSTSVTDDEFGEEIKMTDGLDTGMWIALVLSPGRDGTYGDLEDATGNPIGAGELSSQVTIDPTGKDQDQTVAMIKDHTCDVAGSDDFIETFTFKVESASVTLNPIASVGVGEPLEISGTTNREPETLITISTFAGPTDLPAEIVEVEWPTPDEGVFNATIDTSVAVPGTYTIEADDGDGNTDTKDVEIVAAVPPSEVEVAWWTFEDGCGKIMEGMISDEQEVEWWTFEIGSETLITIEMVATTGDLDPYLELYSADGQLLFSDDDSGEGLNSLILDLWLPLGGSYQIAASRYAGKGEYVINLSCATDSPGQPIEYGQTLAGTINDSRFLHAYLFDGNVGDQLIVNMSDAGSDTLDSYVFLFGPNGNIVDYDDDSGSDHNAQLEVTLPANGMYRLVLTRYGLRDGDSYGVFTASIELVFTLPPKAKQAAEALYSILSDGINETSQVYVIGPVEPGTVIRENTPINDDEWEIARLEVPYTCFVFFIDDKSEFRFVHPVRYAWIDLPTRDYDVIHASLRPVIEDENGVPYAIKPGGSGVVHGIKTIYGEANRGYLNILGVSQVDQAVSYQQSTEQTDQSGLSHAMIGFSAIPSMTAMYGQGDEVGNIDNSVISQSAQASKVVPAKKMALVVDGGDEVSWFGMSDHHFAKDADLFAEYLRKKGYRVARYSQFFASSHPSLETASTSFYWDNFLKVIEKIAKEMNKTTPTSGKHEFFLYYSGHGLNHKLEIWSCCPSTSKYWLPYDKVSNSLAKFNKSCVTITIFLDTCQSGSASKSLAGVCKGRTAPVTLITTTDAKQDGLVGNGRDSGTDDFLEASGGLKERWKYMKNEWWNTNPQFCTCQGGKFSCEK